MKNIIGIGISLPKKLMEKIDTDRGDVPRSRYVLRILERQYTLEREKVNQGSLDRRLETLQSSETFSR
jgi:metal-responsive CopG/Arc/MetJ family transcriptional regulator